MQVYADYTDEAIGKPNLDIKFVDANTAGVVSDPVSMSGFDAQPYQLEYRVGPYTREGRNALSMQCQCEVKYLPDIPRSLQCYRCYCTFGNKAPLYYLLQV